MAFHGSDKRGDIHTYHIYPLTIIVDRYNGTYSGGAFTAWNLHPEIIPDDIYSVDGTCNAFWRELNHDEKSYNYRKYHNKCGVGNTIQEAIDNLQSKLPPEDRMIEVNKDLWILEEILKQKKHIEDPDKKENE